MIQVDPRVGSSFTKSQGRHFDILGTLQSYTRGAAELAVPQLDSGDFAFEGNGPDRRYDIGIERKTLSDMRGSMDTTRWAGTDGQYERMSGAYDIVYLILEGVWRCSKDGVVEVYSNKEKDWIPHTLAAKGPTSKPWLFSELDGHLSSMEIRRNVILVRSTSTIETCHMIANRYRWWQKAWDDHKSDCPLKKQVSMLAAKASLLRLIASQFDGVGWEKSKRVDAAFRSVYEMITASVDDWESAGFTAKEATKLFNVIRGY